MHEADAGVVALPAQETDDVLRGVIAEELTMLALVVGDAVLFQEGQEILGRVAGEGRLAEARVLGEIAIGAGLPV